MIVIRVIDHIPNAFSLEKAKILRTVIEDTLEKDNQIVLNFADIHIFTTAFFNEAICWYILRCGEQEFRKKFEIKGLGKVGYDAYKHAYNNACYLWKTKN